MFSFCFFCFDQTIKYKICFRDPKPESMITLEDIESHDWILPETKEYLSLILQGAAKKGKFC